MSQNKATIRLLIADDHRLFRDGVRALLLANQDIEIVAEAESGAEAVELALAHKPDVILMDIKMPEGDGIEATRQIIEAEPDIQILMTTMFDDDASVFEAMQAGARGYVLKGAKHGQLVRAIRSVKDGEAVFSPSIANRLMRFFGQMRPTSVMRDFPELSERELEVLNLITEGCKNAEIAERLVISPKTVRNHVSNVLRKLQVSSREEAAARARKRGL